MIVQAILDAATDILQEALIDNIPADDTSRAGVVMQGPLQGNPDPDAARVSVTIHENDPDRFYGKSGASAIGSEWEDQIVETECGGSVTWTRRFTVKARCLLTNTQEGLSDARNIATKVRSRIEQALLSASWANVVDEETGEYVSRGAIATTMKSEQVQAGGPPDAYDIHMKIRFEVYTTTI